jgi:hypothetical protein
MIVEDLFGDIEELEYSRIPDGVVNVQALFSGRHNVPASENCELLG